MGLDITAYSKLRHLGWHDGPRHNDAWCENEEHVQAYAYDVFEQSFRGMPTYGKKDGDIVLGGCYEETEDTEDLCFRAGSYGGTPTTTSSRPPARSTRPGGSRTTATGRGRSSSLPTADS